MNTPQQVLSDEQMLHKLCRLAGRRDVIHSQFQGRPMGNDTYEEFVRLRDEQIPELIRAILAKLQAAPQAPEAEHPVISLTGPERVWTCTVIGRAEDLPHGSDAPMRKAVFDAFARMTGDAPSDIFSGWGSPVPERYRAVMEDRLPDPEVIRKECLEILESLPVTHPTEGGEV